MTFDRDRVTRSSVESYSGSDPVTPHDTNDLTRPCVALWIGGAGAGALTIITLAGDQVSFAGVPVGRFPVGASRVLATGTDVTSIVALYY